MPTTLQAKERKRQRRAASMSSLDKAYEAVISNHHGPKFTMRAKVAFGSQLKAKMSENDQTSGPINVGVVRLEFPKWTMRARTCKMLQLPGTSTESVPGPGMYPVKSTVCPLLDHPCLTMPGRTKFASAARFSDGAESD